MRSFTTTTSSNKMNDLVDRIVIVGASVAGVRTAQALRAEGYQGEVILVGSEDLDPYDKPPLSKGFLTGAVTLADLALVAHDAWDNDGITLRLGVAAGSLDHAKRMLHLVDGSSVPYGRIVVATGVRPRMLRNDPAILTLRSLADAQTLRNRLSYGGPLVVVGGGFIGAEIAATAVELGVDVTIVESLPTPFSQVLGPEVGSMIAQLHTTNGVCVVAGTAVEGVDTQGVGRALVRLGDGRELPAAAVVVGIGCIPNTEWLLSSGVPLDNGVVTDQYCRVVGFEDAYAIGDVARWFDTRAGIHRRVEHWTHASQQAQLVAHNIVHSDDLTAHRRAPYFWSDQHGIKIQMVGRASPSDSVELTRWSTPGGQREVALYARAGQFTAAVIFGWPLATSKLRHAWEEHVSITQARRILQTASA
jgi:NADPH-dependent 2,4-dienoyl-CoA reductase/sulfur reductase-like enzyme